MNENYAHEMRKKARAIAIRLLESIACFLPFRVAVHLEAKALQLRARQADDNAHETRIPS